MLLQYAQLIEANYNGFVDQLYAGDRGTALGFDLLQLGLTAATALVKQSAVDDLVTITGIAAGARGSVEKRLFYDRTINALILSMDAERTQVKADMARKRKLNASEYTLEDGIDDLNRLIDAGNINRAFGKITRNAEVDRATAEARLNSIPLACDDIGGDDAALRQRFRTFIDASTTNRDAAVAAMHIDVSGVADIPARLRDEFATKYCGSAGKTELLKTLGAP